MKRILALDLGTKTGYCYTNGDGTRSMGTWTLGTAKEIRQWGKDRLTRTNDPRINRLCNLISVLGTFDVIVFEDVEFSTYTKQTQLWAGLRSAIWLCGLAPVIEAVPVATLKKFATGSGAAKKEDMARSYAKRPEFLFSTLNLDNNGIDAAFLYLWAEKNLSRIA